MDKKNLHSHHNSAQQMEATHFFNNETNKENRNGCCSLKSLNSNPKWHFDSDEIEKSLMSGSIYRLIHPPQGLFYRSKPSSIDNNENDNLGTLKFGNNSSEK